MKTTGIIRRIDELGRIVIPKEIRKNLRIKNGESLEIYLENDSIILKKYSQIESLKNVSIDYVEAFNQIIKHNIIVTDRNISRNKNNTTYSITIINNRRKSIIPNLFLIINNLKRLLLFLKKIISSFNRSLSKLINFLIQILLL